MEEVIDDIRWMFMTRPSKAMLKNNSDIIDGVFSPIPTLK